MKANKNKSKNTEKLHITVPKTPHYNRSKIVSHNYTKNDYYFILHFVIVIILLVMFIMGGVIICKQIQHKQIMTDSILQYLLETGECKLVATHYGFKYMGECDVTDETLRKYNAR